MISTMKGKLLRTTGLVMIGVGVYLVTLGNKYDPDGNAYSNPIPTDDAIIDAEWYEVD